MKIKNRKAVAAVEFALVLPTFIMIIFFIINIALVVSSDFALQHAVLAATMLTKNQADDAIIAGKSPCIGTDQITQEIAQFGQPISGFWKTPPQITVIWSGQYADCNTSSVNPTVNFDGVQIKATLDYPLISSIFGNHLTLSVQEFLPI